MVWETFEDDQTKRDVFVTSRIYDKLLLGGLAGAGPPTVGQPGPKRSELKSINLNN